jgi:CSLREA domain-containing protein
MSRSSFLHVCLILALLVLLSASTLLIPIAHATGASLVVNTTNDEDTDGDGTCSLREAIIAANSNNNYHDCTATDYGADTITFNVSGIITLTATLPTIVDDVTIDGGVNSADVTISGGYSVGAFVVQSGTGLDLRHLTVTKGYSLGGGAGINNNGSASVTDVTFSRNDADRGGAIANGGTLTITNSAFISNMSGGRGGAINSYGGTAFIRDSYFEGNSGGDDEGGGAIASGGILTVTNTTFFKNVAVGPGGALLFRGGSGTITNSTFLDGQYADGGGIAIIAGRVTVINSTLFNNNAGGIQNGQEITLTNTIVANSMYGPNCYGNGVFHVDNHNLDTDGSCGDATTVTAAQLKLGALANNGGPVQTMALGSGSVAIDAGDDAACPSTDQRGVTRPQGAHCDVGAFEASFITGQKFHDDNGDGVKDGSDGGLNGWTIQLQDTSNQVLDSTTTDANGNYTFTVGALPVTYRVREVPQNGWVQSTANPADLKLSLANPGASDINFGNFPAITISGTKFNDRNDNGIRDAGEPGLKNWNINLEDTANNILASATTDANGNFTFANVGPGTYRVREVNKVGWVQTTPNPADVTIQSGSDVTGILIGNSYQADLSIVQTYKAKADGSVTFTLNIKNVGPGKGKRVVVTDEVTDNLLFGGASASQGMCSYDATTARMSCNLRTLKPNQSATVLLTLYPPKSSGAFNNCANVSSKTFDPNLGNNEACVSRP